MPKYYPERPTANGWQSFGAVLRQGGGIVHDLDVNLQKAEENKNILQELVEKRTQRKLEEQRLQADHDMKQKESDAKLADDAHKRKVQEKLATTIKDGVRMGQYDQNLVDGIPDPLLGMRPNAPQKEVRRPADENDIVGIAAEGMDPYQTAALYNKPIAAAASHGYRMNEIGARGDNSRSVADIRARAMERAAHIRTKYGTRGGKSAPKDWKFTMQDASEKLSEIDSDLETLAAGKPKRSWDLPAWNTEMSRLTGQRKFYESQMYKANQNGEPLPGQEADELDSGDGLSDPPPGDPPPRTPPKRQLTDKNQAAKYLAAAGGDKAKARQLAQADGWTF